jgi:cytochrome b561
MTGSYAPPLRALHWLMAAIIFAAIPLGVWALYLPRGTPLRVELLTIHKSLGVTALFLAALRVIVRLATKAPPYGQLLSPLNRFAAGVAHVLLYVAMLALPLSGYVHSMAGGHEFNWFGLFSVPDLVALDKATDDSAGRAHYALAWIIGALLAAHVLAALWHALVKRDGVLARMAPALKRRDFPLSARR